MTPENLFFYNDRLIHSLKTALAVLIGFAITKSIHFPVDQWLIITILVVMCAQMNVGSMLQKSYMRFLGTLTGSIIAIVTLRLFQANILATAIIISFATMLFSFIATSQTSYNELGTLGAVTVVVILITPHPTMEIAIGRFLEINAGILIAAVVSQFILPIHARYHLRFTQATTIRQIRQYYESALIVQDSLAVGKTLPILDEEIVKSLINQRKLALEASRETFRKNNDVTNFKKFLLCEKEILRSITFMYHACHSSPSIKKTLLSLPALTTFHAKAMAAFDQIIDYFEKKTPLSPLNMPDILSLKQAILALIPTLNMDDTVYAYGFLFSAEILVARMSKLIV